MKLVGLMPVRNEEWCLGLTLRAALLWCDEVVVLNHASTDQSEHIIREVINENPTRVYFGECKTSDWEEMRHRQMLLEGARLCDATHIAIVDADEILTGNLLYPTSIVFNALEGQILQLPGYNLRGGIDKYHSSGIWGNRWFSTAFRDDPRLSWGGDRFHHREPCGMPLAPYQPVAQHQGGVMHLWGASERRLRAKSALYKLTERIRWPEKHIPAIDGMYSWAIHGRPGDTPKEWQYRAVPAEWWAPYSHLMQHLHVDAEPWQEAECRRIVSEHPEITAGLDLFGVV